jgi:shikimate kinase
VNRCQEAMIEVAGTCALTGAGPAVYALAEDESRAHAWREELVHRLPESCKVIASQFLADTPSPGPLP